MKNNIVDELRKKIARTAHESQRGVILQPGAIGDCILTLPLAEFMKETVCRGGVDIIGHTEYTGILPGRSCVDAVKSMDSMELHRLFAGEREFEIAEPDESGLIMAFADYTWIVTFLGEPGGDFERNLIFTANCSHSAEVMTLEMKPGPGLRNHITEFYREQFIEQSGFNPSTALPRQRHSRAGETGKLTASGLSAGEHKNAIGMPLIRPTPADAKKGKEILAEHGVIPARKPVIIQPGSGGRHKCWHLRNFLSAARMLANVNAEVVFILGPAERERFSESETAEIKRTGTTLANLNMADVLAVMSCSRGYVGNDSGITHLAAALGIRTVAVFGPTEPVIYGPLGPAVTILRSAEPGFASVISQELQEKAVEAIMQ